jgi:hypothetical protein
MADDNNVRPGEQPMITVPAEIAAQFIVEEKLEWFDGAVVRWARVAWTPVPKQPEHG